VGVNLFQNGGQGRKFSFDFGGVYDKIEQNELITYTLGDGRKVKIVFTSQGNQTKVTETFEAEMKTHLKYNKPDGRPF